MNKKFDRMVNYFATFSAFVLAVIIVMIVHHEKYGNFKLLSKNSTQIFEDVPILNNIDMSKYVLEGVPSHANVSVTGPLSEVSSIKQKKPFQLYIEAKSLNKGSNQVEIKIRKYSNSLIVNVLPKFVNISAYEIVKKKFNIYHGLINEQELDEKEKIKSVTLNKSQVEFQGAQNLIDSISYAKAIIDCSDLTTSEKPRISAYDKDGNIIKNVNSTTEVNAEIKLNKK